MEKVENSKEDLKNVVVGIRPPVRDDGVTFTLSCLARGIFHLWLHFTLGLTRPVLDR